MFCECRALGLVPFPIFQLEFIAPLRVTKALCFANFKMSRLRIISFRVHIGVELGTGICSYAFSLLPGNALPAHAFSLVDESLAIGALGTVGTAFLQLGLQIIDLLS